ncbi:MAG: M23 family metallopeptidase [Cyanobium sp. Prado107]|jgi:murein DD-endopeptidase MepM/ murein hydrolase activator NlpD|nr:M23 family metallopeptidase [Cyanobium sp. Prado107]
MLWGCSEIADRDAGVRGWRAGARLRLQDASPRGRHLAIATALGGLITGALVLHGGPLQLQPVQARSMWNRGVFPVVSFAGYTSHFGTRTGPWGAVEPHYGLDIAAPMGSPIRNWWGGVVESVINDGTCGLGLVIRSGDYEHIYCHLSGSVSGGVYRSGPVAIRAGQAIRTGELIGHVGVTGRSTGPHLHWGMRFRNAWMDPALVLRAMARARQGAV